MEAWLRTCSAIRELHVCGFLAGLERVEHRSPIRAQLVRSVQTQSQAYERANRGMCADLRSGGFQCVAVRLLETVNCVRKRGMQLEHALGANPSKRGNILVLVVFFGQIA